MHPLKLVSDFNSRNKFLYFRYRGPILDLHLSISNGFVSSKIYDKRDDFDFDIVNFPLFFFLMEYGVYFSTYKIC